QTSTYQNNQYQSSSNQQHTQNNQQQFDQSSNHAKEVTQESKGFFKSAFVAPDEVIKSKHAFSFKLLLSLLIAGFLVVAILLAMTI
ncbi:zinc ribbon domain-containing protein, partial [Staphylococcus capitis]